MKEPPKGGTTNGSIFGRVRYIIDRRYAAGTWLVAADAGCLRGSRCAVSPTCDRRSMRRQGIRAIATMLSRCLHEYPGGNRLLGSAGGYATLRRGEPEGSFTVRDAFSKGGKRRTGNRGEAGAGVGK